MCLRVFISYSKRSNAHTGHAADILLIGDEDSTIQTSLTNAMTAESYSCVRNVHPTRSGPNAGRVRCRQSWPGRGTDGGCSCLSPILSLEARRRCNGLVIASLLVTKQTNQPSSVIVSHCLYAILKSCGTSHKREPGANQPPVNLRGRNLVQVQQVLNTRGFPDHVCTGLDAC